MKKGPLELEVEDWKRDTLPLSLAAKGAWIDILGALHTAPNRGVMTLPLQGWARLIGATVDQAKAVIQELVDMRVPDHVTDGNDNVTLMSRRMIREEKERKSIRSRVENYRKRKCNASVTQMYSESQRYIAVTKEKESSPPQEKEKIPPHTPLLKEKELPPLQEKEKKTLLSSSEKPNIDPLPLSGRREAREVLDFLNQKANRHYRPSETNLKLIQARLRSGATVAQCKQVIALKARKWLLDPKMAEYLRPATLFNATKFEQYIGELLIHVDDNDVS